MKTVILNKEDIYRGTLLLVNHKYLITNDQRLNLQQHNITKFNQLLTVLSQNYDSALVNDLKIKKQLNDIGLQVYLEEKNYYIFLKEAVKFGFVEKNQQTKQKSRDSGWYYYYYVGYPHSLLIEKNKWCLKQYHQWLKDYSIYHPYLYSDDKNIIEIFYVFAASLETKLYLSEKRHYQISGNNYDGFIVSAWRQLW